eukprot:366039-Chlamydomonas_euryale.AAC.17
MQRQFRHVKFTTAATSVDAACMRKQEEGMCQRGPNCEDDTVAKPPHGYTAHYLSYGDQRTRSPSKLFKGLLRPKAHLHCPTPRGLLVELIGRARCSFMGHTFWRFIASLSNIRNQAALEARAYQCAATGEHGAQYPHACLSTLLRLTPSKVGSATPLTTGYRNCAPSLYSGVFCTCVQGHMFCKVKTNGREKPHKHVPMLRPGQLTPPRLYPSPSSVQTPSAIPACRPFGPSWNARLRWRPDGVHPHLHCSSSRLRESRCIQRMSHKHVVQALQSGNTSASCRLCRRQQLMHRRHGR